MSKILSWLADYEKHNSSLEKDLLTKEFGLSSQDKIFVIARRLAEVCERATTLYELREALEDCEAILYDVEPKK